MLSNDNGFSSRNKSDKITETIIGITDKDITDTEKEDIIRSRRFIVRKTAHFILYFVLGVLVYCVLKSYNVNKYIILYSVLFCFIYSISDEIHQIFTIDRTFKVYDIIIDTVSSTLSILLCNSFKKKI